MKIRNSVPLMEKTEYPERILRRSSGVIIEEDMNGNFDDAYRTEGTQDDSGDGNRN